MKAKAVRLHGANDLRLDEFELPEIKEDEILVKVVSDSVCMSTYKCAILGVNHKRVHEDVADHPAIMGHEMAGDIVKVGAKHQDKFKPGMKFTLQPALNYKGTMWSPGYSYEFFGGDTTYCIIPAEVMELGCLLEYKGKAYYEASLAEPMSCSIGAFNAAYHTHMGVYKHEMGIKKDGKLAILAGAGPMGLGALTYALHRDIRPKMVVVADVNQERLDRAAHLFPVEEAAADGIETRSRCACCGIPTVCVPALPTRRHRRKRRCPRRACREFRQSGAALSFRRRSALQSTPPRLCRMLPTRCRALAASRNFCLYSLVRA